MDFHNLNIKSIKREAAESVELTFEIPSDLQGEFSFEQKDKVNGIYLCGPSMLIDKSIARLKSITFPKEKIHREYFAAPELDEEEISFDFRVLPERKVYVKLKGEPLEITIHNDQDILRKLIDHGYDSPYSCLQGTCSTCKAKLISREVKMRVDIGLEDDEIEKGYILTCQSIPTTAEVSCEYLNFK